VKYFVVANNNPSRVARIEFRISPIHRSKTTEKLNHQKTNGVNCGLKNKLRFFRETLQSLSHLKSL